MNIKEIAPKLTQKLSIAINDDEAVEFAEALISAYKAELLKEVGEPFGFYYEINGTWDAFVVGKTEPDDDVYDEGSLKALFTSDQVAAAIQHYKDSVLNEVGEPVCYLYKDHEGSYRQAHDLQFKDAHTPVFTSDQLIAARKGLEEEIERLKAELAKYRDAPCVAYATTNEEDDLTMLFFDAVEARKYSGDDEPIKLIVKPGE